MPAEDPWGPALTRLVATGNGRRRGCPTPASASNAWRRDVRLCLRRCPWLHDPGVGHPLRSLLAVVGLVLAVQGCGDTDQTGTPATGSTLVATSPSSVAAEVGGPSATLPGAAGSPLTFTPSDAVDGSGSLYLLSLADGGVETVPLPGPQFSWADWPRPAPVWSADGSQVAVVDTYGSVGIVDSSGGAGVTDASSDPPAWSTQPVPGASQQISERIQEGTATSPDGQMEATATFEPDGSMLTFQIEDVTGGTTPVDTAVQTAAPFAWSPDSRSIAASGYFEVVLIDATDATSVILAQEPDVGTSFEFGGFAWSPDGSRLAFTGRSSPPSD